MKIAIVTPYHPLNAADLEACHASITFSFDACQIERPTFYAVLGETVGNGIDPSTERDTEIWKGRQKGTAQAYADGADFFYQVDADVRVPPNWAWWATTILPRDAVAFPTVNHQGFVPRFVSERFEAVWDTWAEAHPFYGSECVGFSRGAYEAMLKASGNPWANDTGIWATPNEDYNLSRSLHKAGFQFTNGRCEVVAY